MSENKVLKYSGISLGVLIGVWLVIEVISISSWSANTTFGRRVGIIEYRDSFGEFNRITMRVNESMMWVFGYEFTGIAMYGNFGQWMHSYTKEVSE